MKMRIEDELKYCPCCHDEYRPEIDTCASCEVTLLDGKSMRMMLEKKQGRAKDRNMTIGPEETVVDIRRGPILQIKQIQAFLAEHGIASLLTGEQGGGCGKGCCGTEITLQVRLTDAREVMALLEEEHRRATGLDDHDTSHLHGVFNPAEEEAICPACGCTFATTTTTCPDCGLCFF